MSDRRQRALSLARIEVGGISYEPQRRAPEGQLVQLPGGHTKDIRTGLMIDQYGCASYAPRPVLRIYDPLTGDFCWYVPPRHGGGPG